MKPEGMDRRLLRAGALLCDPRVVRRVIMADRDIVGLQVPHTHCYALSRAALLAATTPVELGVAPSELPEEVVLVARPPPAEVARAEPQDLLGRLWRTIFHAKVHLAFDRQFAAGALDPATLRRRILALGQVEFDEIRAILRHDDRLLPPGSEREQYVEFAALYLELRHFAPELVPTTFPGLGDTAHVDAVLATDVDAHALLDASCPDGAEPAGTIVREPPRSTRASQAPRSLRAEASSLRPVSPRRAARLSRAADAAKRRGNDVRSALLRATAAAGLADRHEVDQALRRDLRDLSQRLNRALSLRQGLDPEVADVQWASLLSILVDEAVRRRRLRFSVEARLLYDLQLAAVAHEKAESAADLVTWALSLGRRPVVRPLPATREVRIARRIHAAARKVRLTHIDTPERRLLAKMMRWASERADRNVRLALRPEIQRVLTTVGLVPRDSVEQLARDKLVEELLDRIVLRGFFSFTHLRDALSRNQLKLEDLASAREWLRGDPLLAADRLLGEALDGVYRRGEIYLRGFQRLSALPFGTRLGRLLFLFLLLPLGAAFVVLEGLGHILVGPIARALGHAPVAMLTWPSLLATAVVVLGLVHVPWLRTGAWKLLSLFGWLFVLLFVRLPRWLLGRTVVKWVLRTRLLKATFRRVLVPFGLTAVALLSTPVGALPLEYLVAGALAAFFVLSLLMTSRVGEVAEAVLFDWLAPRWRTFSHQVLPGILRLVVELFRRLMDRLERALYRVDEWLRFRPGQSRPVLWLKAVLGVGWFAVAYVTRLYVTLLVEPELNPVKHFPVITVAHKLFLPLTPAMLAALQAPLEPLGPVIAGTFAGVTVFLLPSFFGFLAWELKENWKLYHRSRAKVLPPAAFGPHGETIGRLMVPGIHSGTLPKLYTRLRLAAQREDEAARARDASGRGRPVAEGARGRFREAMEELELAVRRFIEREFIALLTSFPRWTAGPLEVRSVHLVSNRVRVEMACPGLGAEPAEIAFEDKDGLLVASLPTSGFIGALPPEPHPLRTAFENALAGLYQLAGVDVVREQLLAALGEHAHYDLVGGRLLVWPEADYRTQLEYRLAGGFGRSLLRARRRGAKPERPPAVLDRRQMLFRAQPLSWEAWVAAWSHEPARPLESLRKGLPLLPAPPPPPSAEAVTARTGGAAAAAGSPRATAFAATEPASAATTTPVAPHGTLPLAPPANTPPTERSR